MNTEIPTDDVRELRGAILRLGQRLRAARTRSTLAPTQTAVLARLYHSGEAQPRDLAHGLGVQPQSLTRVLAQLESQGLLSRRPDPEDGRAQILMITSQGASALNSDMASRDEWLRSALAELNPTQRGVLLLAAPLMDALAAMPETQDGEAWPSSSTRAENSADLAS